MIIASQVNANTFYCDSEATGKNDGTSWIDAWTDIVAAVTLLSPGDTLFVSGGTESKTYYVAESIVPASGVSGNVVTIQTGQDEGHNGMVIIDGKDIVGKLIDVRNTDFMTISGNVDGNRHMTIQNWGGEGEQGFSFAFNGWGGVIAGVTIDHVNVINDDLECTDETCETRPELKTCVYFTRATDFTTIKNSYFDGCVKMAIYINYDTPTDYDQLYVKDNIIKGYKNLNGEGGPDLIAGARGVTVSGNIMYYEVHENAEFEPIHPAEDGVQIIGYSGTEGNAYTKVFNNIMYDISNSMIRADALTNCEVGVCPFNEIQIYNNLIYMTDDFGYPRAIEILLSGHNINVYNNTIAGFARYNGIVIRKWQDDVGLSIKNNILLDSPLTIDSAGEDLSLLDINNNLFIKSDGSIGDYFLYNRTNRTRTYLSQDIDLYNSEKNFSFVDYTKSETNSDFHLAATANMAIDTGVDLSGYFTTDIDGRRRSKPFDLGAYEFFDKRKIAALTSSLLFLINSDE